MLEGNSTHCSIPQISVLFIVVLRIRQCTDVPVMIMNLFLLSLIFWLVAMYFIF